MWHSDDFIQNLDTKHGKDNGIWKKVIQKGMKDAVSWSLQCVQDAVSHRKNSCELYGYDFMIDDNYQVSISSKLGVSHQSRVLIGA